MLLLLSAFLPAVLVAGEAASKVVAGRTDTVPFVDSIRIDSRSSHATFTLTCSGCAVAPGRPRSDLDLHFDLSLSPTGTRCAANVSLNSVALPSLYPHRWNENTLSLSSSGHELSASLHSACVAAEEKESVPAGRGRPATQVVAISLLTLDNNALSPPLPGFTISLNDVVPQFVRFDDKVSVEVFKHRLLDNWVDPPPPLRIVSTEYHDSSATNSTSEEIDSGLQSHIDELRQLEAERAYIQRLIDEKSSFIHSEFHTQLRETKAAISKCEGFLCILKTLFTKAHDAARMAYLKWRPNPYEGGPRGNNQHALAKIMNSSDVTYPTPPNDCHCRDGRPSEKAQPGLPGASHNGTMHWPEKDDGSRTHSRAFLILKFFMSITGLVLLYKLARRCCGCSAGRRRSRERALRRERRAADRAQRRSAQRQRVADWWHGCHRGRSSNHHRIVTDYSDEKAALVAPQERLLERHMQDEISQLQIQHEIQQIRDTRNVVDELVRAEEGRSGGCAAGGRTSILGSSLRSYISHPPPSSSSSNSTAPPAYPAGFAPLPIAIPPPPRLSSSHHHHHHHHHHLDQPYPSPSQSSSCSSSNDQEEPPLSPLSRTTSLPSYRSKPPSYHEDDDGDGDADVDAFSDDGSLQTSMFGVDELGTGEWSPGSSIPDLSPRESGETARTFV